MYFSLFMFNKIKKPQIASFFKKANLNFFFLFFKKYISDYENIK